jgi:hypothetical protein
MKENNQRERKSYNRTKQPEKRNYRLINSIHDEREFAKDWLALKSNHFNSSERKLLHL